MRKNLMAVGIASILMAKRGGNKSGGGSGSTSQSAPVGEVNMEVLRGVVSATQQNSFVFTHPSVHTPMVAAGLVEVNTAMANDKGELATRATAAGAAKVAEVQQTNAQTQQTTPSTGPQGAKPSFTVVTGVPIPTVKRGGRSGTIYPFDTLEVNGSFFVPATNDKPNPAKSLASTVSSATNRYAVEDGTKQVQERDAEGNKLFLDEAKTQPKMITVPNYKITRKFEARSVEDGAPWGQPGVKGAGVWRTQ